MKLLSRTTLSLKSKNHTVFSCKSTTLVYVAQIDIIGVTDESAGAVIEVGFKVASLQEGDRVTMEPSIPCRYCARCKKGNSKLCVDMAFVATPLYDGTLAKYYVLSEDFCYKLPENMSLEEGALQFCCETGRVAMVIAMIVDWRADKPMLARIDLAITNYKILI